MQSDEQAEVEQLREELQSTIAMYTRACEELVHAQKKVRCQLFGPSIFYQHHKGTYETRIYDSNHYCSSSDTTSYNFITDVISYLHGMHSL